MIQLSNTLLDHGKRVHLYHLLLEVSQVSGLGADLLFEIFQSNDSLGDELVDQLIERIFMTVNIVFIIFYTSQSI